MPERHEMVHVGWRCAKVKGHSELKIEKPREKTFSYDFPRLHHSNPNSYGVNVHLRQHFLNSVKVIERSRDVTPRSKYKKSKGHPTSSCALDMVEFRVLFPELQHFEKKGGARHFSLIGRHLESVGRTELVFKSNLALSEKRSTGEFWPIGAFFYRVIVLTSQVATFVPGQRSKVAGS